MGEAAAKEPTMEDILSSIRKIIAEEGEPEAGEAEAASDSPAPALDEPVETSRPVDTPREESQPNLQQIVDKVASVSEPATDSADIKAPAASQPAPVDPAPQFPPHHQRLPRLPISLQASRRRKFLNRQHRQRRHRQKKSQLLNHHRQHQRLSLHLPLPHRSPWKPGPLK